MIIGQQPSSATFRPAVGQCQCGNINNCICGGAMGIPPHAELPNQCIPYNPSMPIPADVSQPHLYDTLQMPTTSQYNMQPCASQQLPPQAPQQGHPQYPPQNSNACNAAYGRPPSRVQANSHTMQWMSNHYMNNGYSPAPSVTPSVMSMSHMSIPDDHLSQMSIHCPSEMRTPIDTPQFTELRPCSQISTASCVENIDPRMPRQQSQNMSYQQLIEWYHNENLRSEVVNETFKIARGLTKGIGPLPDFQLLVKITEVFKYWNLLPQEECAKKLASAMFYLCKYLPSTEVKKALSATSGDMIHILVGLAQYNNGALLALIHMIEWRNREGVELRAFCRNPKVFDLFMQKLVMVDQKNLGCYQYVLEGLRLLCHNNKEAKDYLIAWGQNNQQYTGPKGIVAIVFLIFFRFLDQMCHSVDPKYKEFICTSYTKALALLHSIIMRVEPKQVDRVNVAVAQQIFQCNGPQTISHYICVGSAMAMKYAMELLASLTNSEFAAAIDHLPPDSVQAIVRNVLQGLQMLINDSRLCNDPSLWEKTFAFIGNFIANRTPNKLILIDLNGFEAIVYAIMRFSNFKERKDMTAQQYITLNELADNADLCLSALMSVKTLNLNQVKLRDAAINNNALRGILNQLCQADIYVQKRVLRLLYQLVDTMPIFRSDGYLQQVFDDFRKENLIGCLYRIIASAPEQLAILDNKQNATNKDVERRRLVPDVLCRAFNLLSLILKYCNLGPREDILLLVKNNPIPVMDVLKYFYQEVELCGTILKFCSEVALDEIIASRWLADRPFLDSLVNSCDPKIAVPAQCLMTRLCTAGDFEPLAGMFTGMNGGYLE